MPSFPQTNEKPAAATIRDGLDLVSSSTPLTWKDSSNGFLHHHGARG